MKLYRGFNKEIEKGYHQNIFLQKSRRPTDNSELVHNISDKWFMSKFGVHARSRTIICSTDISQAREYGGVYNSWEVVPIGSYRIIYSYNVRDLIDITYDINIDVENEIIEWLDSKSYQVVDCVNQIAEQFKGEVMLVCDKFELKEVLHA